MKLNVKRHAVTQPLDPTVRLIPLTRNQNTIVDATDYDWLTQWNWRALWNERTKSFYAVRDQNQRRIYMHRLLLGLQDEDKRQGDHINHDTLSNRRSNLRVVTQSQNNMNRGKKRNSVSGYKGVTACNRKSNWKAYIGVNGKTIYLGSFATPEAAHAAYCEAAEKLHGEFAKLD